MFNFTGPVYVFDGITADNIRAIVADELAKALAPLKEQIMSELDNLEAAETTLETAVANLAAEQATFLADIAVKLAGAVTNGIDPTAVQAVADQLNAQATKLNDLAAAQAAADPAAPAPAATAAPTDPAAAPTDAPPAA